MTIYIDSLFLTNFFMDSVILFITAIMCGFAIKPVRVFLVGGLSAVYGIFVFFPHLSFAYSALLRVGAAALFVYAAFGKSGYLRSFLTFMLVSVSMAGILLLLTQFTDFGVILGSAVSNCIMYMNVNPILMLFGCIALYFLMEVYRRMCIKNFTCDSLLVDFLLFYGGKSYKLTGLIDTGCELFEPLSGSPVIVADKKFFKDIENSEIKIYISTASGKCGLDMLLPEKIVSVGEWEIVPNVVLALSDNGFENERYNALINPAACRKIKKGRRQKENDGIKNSRLVKR